MIEELKKIREELLKAIDNNDLLYAKMMINRLDTVIYNANKVNKNDLCPDVSKQRELLIAFVDWATENDTTHWLDTNPEIVAAFLKSNL